MKSLAPHQSICKADILALYKAYGILPTASGKSLIQAHMVRDVLVEGGFKVVLIKSPRIGLSNQLNHTYISEFEGLNYMASLVHSGDKADFDIDADDDIDEQMAILDAQLALVNVQKLQKAEEVRRFITECQVQNVPAVIFTTYHSNLKVVDALRVLHIPIYMDINDECHYLVRRDFQSILEHYTATKQYFFTATKVTSDSPDGWGMNNEARFGPMAYHLSVRDAIHQGIILPIVPHVVKSNATITEQSELDQQVGEVIEKAFAELGPMFPTLGTKLLVSARGSKQIKTFLESDQHQALLEAGANILTVHSTDKYITHNGNVIKRSEFEAQLSILGNNPSTNLIIVHYDILAEGIDVPGILGVLILRNLKQSKFFQTLGRAVRVLRNQDGTINTQYKSYGVVMFPDIVGEDSDMVWNFRNLIRKLREEGYVPTELRDDAHRAIPDQVDPEPGFTPPVEDPQSLSEFVGLDLYLEQLNLTFESELTNLV